MNPTSITGSVPGIRVPAGHGDRQRRQSAHDAFRRALQQEGAPRESAEADADAPKPSALQPKRPVGRNNQDGNVHHIDVVV
jgi:hypothetical protein